MQQFVEKAMCMEQFFLLVFYLGSRLFFFVL